MKLLNKLTPLILVLPFLASCSFDFKKLEAKAALINHYEKVSVGLARENRELHASVKRLEFEIEKLKHNTGGHAAVAVHETKHEAKQVDHEEHAVAVHAEHAVHAVVAHEPKTTHEDKGRSIASVAPTANGADLSKDFVEFKIYKWHAEDLIQIADKEFKEKSYEKAAQFYNSLITNYPTHKFINDEFYFKAGIASYESGTHHDWTISHFEALMAKYPTSQYFRSSKLWIGLTHLKLGDKKKFYSTVEEFRKKYRNTNEWKILSSYYEKIEEKTHE